LQGIDKEVEEMIVQAQLKWTEGRQFVARAGDGPAVVIDSRPAVDHDSQEGRSGPGPMQMVLMGVAGCTAVDVLLIMQKRRAQVTDFQVNISGQRAEEHPRCYTKIHIEYVLYGRKIKPKDVERAIQLSETKYCSALASLNADVEHSYHIHEGHLKETTH
jgi:putative redox protein